MKKVLIIFGGNSYEHEISCMSVNFIKDNIDNKLFDYTIVGIDYDNIWYEINNNIKIDMNWKNNIILEIDNIINYIKKFNIIFPIVHGNIGEDGKLQNLFELYNMKFVGCNSFSSIISYDKLLTKLILEKNNIPQVPYLKYNSKLNLNSIKYPVIIKPCKCGSSIGISIANNNKQLKQGIKLAKKYDKNVLIEKYLTNKRELECAILKKKNKLIVSNVGEIMNNGTFYSFNSKYKSNTKTSISNIDTLIKNQIKRYAKDIFKILECSSMARLDFFYDLNDKRLYFNEINTVPGFTENSMYPILIKKSGINYKKLITILLSH